MGTGIIEGMNFPETFDEGDPFALDLDDLHAVVVKGGFVQDGIKERIGGFRAQRDSTS